MKKNLYKSFAILSASMLMGACTGNFEAINTDPNGVTDQDLEQDNKLIGMHFPSMMQSIYFNQGGGNWEFQIIQNLNADIWSGYMASATNFAGGVNNQTYFMMSGWNDNCWSYAYNKVMKDQALVTMKCDAKGDKYKHFKAINSIIRVLTMSRIADQYGPIIYSKFGESKTGGTYDSAQEAYKTFFKELTDASTLLNSINKDEVASFAMFDPAYGGDLSQWARLANTLRLRLAMRVVKYDAVWAKTEAEAAIAANGGLIENGGNFTIKGFGWTHPLYTISRSWGDIRISANLQSILGGYNDPRLAKYAVAPKEANGVIKGIRTGIPGLDETDNAYKAVVACVNVEQTSPAILVTAAEVQFLLAEAALRGWNTGGGTAKAFYEKGIASSFGDWGVAMGDYTTRYNKPAAWVDPVKADFNANAVSTVSPSWDDATTDEQRLEKIITQKWIAGYPEGMNAWAEWRRTGYPKLFPILKNDSQGAIPTELGVRRLPFTEAERTNNPTGYAKAVELLGGADTGATRIFWDKDQPNF